MPTLSLTSAQLWALEAVLVDYLVRPDRVDVFLDVVSGDETSVVDLVVTVHRARPDDAAATATPVQSRHGRRR